MRVQNDLGVGEVPGGDSLIQSLSKSSGSRHVCGLAGQMLLIGRIYTTQQTRPFQAKPLKRAGGGDDCMVLVDGMQMFWA